MNIGDKVRLIHGKEEGIVRNLLRNNLVEVEIEDGFVIPVLKNELTVIAREETNYFKSGEVSEVPSQKPGHDLVADQGIFLAFVEINDQQLSLHFINNTDYVLLVSLSGVEAKQWIGMAAEKLEAKGSFKVKDYYLKDFDQWPELHFQIFYHRMGYYSPREPLKKRIRFKASSLFKMKQTAPLIGKKAYLIQIDKDQEKIDPEKIKESLLAASETQIASSDVVENIVDLHIEKLVKNHQHLNNADILNIQLQYFEKKLDQAIVAGKDEIIFIHGVGNGVLRNAIHKKLSKFENIQYFKDAMKEKFGFGATLIRIK